MADTSFVARLTQITANWANQINRYVFGGANAAGIRSLDSTIYTRFRTLGYYTAGDGGAGDYYLDPTDTTSTDNGGTIFVAGDGGRWKLSPNITPTLKHFGAKGDDSTDDTTAFNNLCAALANGVGKVTKGTYRLTAGSIVNPIRLVGDSRLSCILKTVSDSGNIITVNTTGRVELEEITFVGTNTATSNSLVKLSGGAPSGNAFSYIANCQFQAGFIHIDTDASNAWTIEKNYFTGFRSIAVNVANSVNADSGDSAILDNIFANPGLSTAIPVVHVSSGGLRIEGNKFNGGQFNYKMQLNGATSDLVIVGNSMENATQAAISFVWTVGSFNNILVDGNQISGTPTGISMADTNHFFDQAVISGNLITAVTTYGLIVDNAHQVSVEGNVLNGVAATTGIVLGTSATVVVGDSNKIEGFTNRLVNNSTNGCLTLHSRPLITFGSATAMPADVTEDIVCSAYLPAGLFSGALGSTNAGNLEVEIYGTCTNNANAKTIRFRLGGLAGTLMFSDNVASCASFRIRAQISVAAANTQRVVGETLHDATPAILAASTQTVNTNVVNQIVVTTQKAVAGDAITINSVSVKMQYQ